MHKLIKQLNKFNGNLCFVGATDTGDIVFECDRGDRTLSYDASSKFVLGLCLENESSYLVSFGDNYIGQYSGGVLDETYIDTGLSRVDKIVRDSQGNIYILNRVDNLLVKYNSGVIWTINLPDYDLRSEGQILLRESDGCIVYHNNTNIHIVRDSVSGAVVLNSLEISGSGSLKAIIGGQFNPSYSYARARTVSGSELDQSSSSSSESSDSSSSSSSLSSSSSSSQSSESSSSEV